MSASLRLHQALAGRRSFSPFYHAVGEHDMPHLRHLLAVRTTSQFRDDLDFLLKNFSLVSLDDLIAAAKESRALPANYCFVSVDDGLRETHDVMAPILEEKGVPATFFICSDFVDNRVLGWKQKVSLIVDEIRRAGENAAQQARNVLQQSYQESRLEDVVAAVKSIKYAQADILDQLAESLHIDFNEFLSSYRPYVTSDHLKSLVQRGFSLGAHSKDHPLYAELSESECLAQSVESMDWLQDKFNVPVRTFAHPFHSSGLSKRHMNDLLGAGRFELVFGTAGGKVDVDTRVIHRNQIEDPQRRTIQDVVESQLRRYTAWRLTRRHIMRRN